MYDDDSDDYGFDDGYGGYAPPQPFNIRQALEQQNQQFRQLYSAYPIAAYMDNKADANYGGKIFMPPSALEDISHRNVVYPLLFKLQNDNQPDGSIKRTHCGVLEFTAEEGRVYLPQWMMETLGLSPGSVIEVINVALLRGSMVKLQPQSTDFLDISDHRAVLENALRKFSALTVGDIIAFEYNGREYKVAVIETQPSPTAINIVETDLSVDFAPPVGYVEPTRPETAASGSSANSRPSSGMAKDIRRREEKAKDERAGSRFAAFRGSGNRLSSRSVSRAAAAADDGRPPSVRSYASNSLEADAAEVKHAAESDVPVPLDLPVGTLFFGYDLALPPGAEAQEASSEDAEKFHGAGRMLRQRRKR
ncbi:ubiquitin fusion degradation protein [Coemansia interrupta]|uniref:Ubiquitin fusion degradation protein n=1 Tax=Coemansia interrupta TaxID=1126814 RepID=A0A9W8HG77_9FUNG|nr:ubiquitin fusion degradation protein [Coemansia interrupta]